MTTQPTDQVQRALASWHSTHPRATLAEIEAAVEDELDHLRARLVKERTASAFVDEHSLCQHCGSGMVLRAITTRTVFLRGDEPLELERKYVVCPTCGAGFSPPG